MIKVAIIGQSAFGESVASEISKINDCIITGIFTPPNQDKDPLYQYGIANNIKVFRFDKLRSKTAIEEFNKLSVDLLVMAYVTDIVPMDIINNPKKGTIQYHPSLLPKHRGPSSINWAIINGDNHTGITIFWPDEGLDTGPILMQKKVKILPDDTTGSLYFDKLFPIGVKSMIDSIKLVISNKAPKIIQDEKQASYESWCSKKEIDWDKQPKQIYNLIRGCDPQPGAWTKIDSKTVFLYNCQIEENEDTSISKKFIIKNKKVSIGLRNKKITIGRIKDQKGNKINAYEWFEENNLSSNSKLG
ncbi:MAG: formyltransferase family protein [Chloroflexota bacterium]|nr:formyltransferase family protein [Chloroflexota bacterium]